MNKKYEVKKKIKEEKEKENKANYSQNSFRQRKNKNPFKKKNIVGI